MDVLSSTRAFLCTSVLVRHYNSMPLHELEIVITGHVNPQYRLDNYTVFTTKHAVDPLCLGHMGYLIIDVRSIFWNITKNFDFTIYLASVTSAD